MMLKYCFPLVFLIVFLSFDTSIGFTDDSALWTHFTYMFQHAGWLHLIINSIAFVGMFMTLGRFVSKWWLVLMCLLGGFTASFAGEYHLPTVGASGMVYVMIGIYISYTLFSKDVKITSVKKYAWFVVSSIAMLAAGWFLHGVNFWLHLCGFGLGLVWGTVNDRTNGINKTDKR